MAYDLFFDFLNENQIFFSAESWLLSVAIDWNG